MLKFRITLRRYYNDHAERKSEFPSSLFFPSLDDNLGKFREIGEDRILEVALSEKFVKEVRYNYGQKDSAVAIKAFIQHQLGHGSSVQTWTSMYGEFSCTDVRQIDTE